MKTIRNLILFLAASGMFLGFQANAQRFRHVASEAEKAAYRPQRVTPESAIVNDSVLSSLSVDSTYLDSLKRVRSVEEIIDGIKIPEGSVRVLNLTSAPWIFTGYRQLGDKTFATTSESLFNEEVWREAAVREAKRKLLEKEREEMISDIDNNEESKENGENGELDWGALGKDKTVETKTPEIPDSIVEIVYPSIMKDPYTPEWLHYALTASRIQQDFMYSSMLADPSLIDYAYWDLPVPPRLPDEDHSFGAYIKSLHLPEVDVSSAKIETMDTEKTHWLHVFNTALQFSQAYLSENWYQGGNNYLSLLFNFLWDVQLNQVWHPNVMFQSTLSYKLGLNTEQNDEYRKYSISQDLFQYNMKFGLKASHNWYYSITTQFKTQLLNNYKKNTQTRMASFLSPGELNVGLGMSYSKQNKKKTVSFTASIAPISYNLKTCIDPEINPTQFNIHEGDKIHNEIGSSAELNFNAKIFSNVTYKTRLFLFSDYKYFQGDWENTLNFQFNRFFSTQIYAHLRYDSSYPSIEGSSWHKWMLKEILSVGLSYNFSTK